MLKSSGEDAQRKSEKKEPDGLHYLGLWLIIVDEPESNLVANNPLSRFLILFLILDLLFYYPFRTRTPVFGGPPGQTTAIDNALGNTVVECDG